MWQGGRWRSIPPELLVPIALGAVVRVLLLVLPHDRVMSAQVFGVDGARGILVLCGLLELRRRLPGRSMLLAVAAAAQAAVLVAHILVRVVLPLVARDLLGPWLEIDPIVVPIAAVIGTVALISAARAWRTLLAPVVLATTVLDRPLVPVMDVLDAVLGGREAITAFIAFIVLVHAVALLALFRRLAAGLERRPDFARAVRAAGRAARSLRLRVLFIVGFSFLAGVLQALGVPSVAMVLFACVALGTLGTLAGLVSGLLGLARAQIDGLSPFALCAAAFGALVHEAGQAAAWRGVSGAGAVPSAIVLWLIVIACTVMGVWAIRDLAIVRRDRVLRDAVSTRLIWLVGLELTMMASLMIGAPRQAGAVLAYFVFVLVCQTALSLVHASVFARARERLALASTVDVF